MQFLPSQLNPITVTGGLISCSEKQQIADPKFCFSMVEKCGDIEFLMDVCCNTKEPLSLSYYPASQASAIIGGILLFVQGLCYQPFGPNKWNQDMTKLQRLCDFALNCLKHLPRPVCPLLAPVFLDTVPEVLGVTHADAQGQMLDCAVTAEKDKNSGSQVQVLIHLGLALGVPAWLELYRKRFKAAGGIWAGACSTGVPEGYSKLSTC
eukprot:1153800-Pelagomonas_calceolata.AAC.4